MSDFVIFRHVSNHLVIIPMKLTVVTLLVLFPTLHAQTSNFQRLPLYGNTSWRHYYLEMYLGTPPAKQLMIVDSGSQLMTINCGDCEGCKNNIIQNYKQQKSSTSRKILCNTAEYICKNQCQPTAEDTECAYRQIYYQYLASTQGYLKKDLVYFTKIPQESEAIQAVFGCANKRNGTMAKTKENGLIGIAPYPKSNPFYLWFTRSIQTISKIVTVCLGENGGYLQLGKSPYPQPPNKQDVIINFRNNSPVLTTFDVEEIKVGDLDLFNKPLIQKYGFDLDTGSTISMLPKNQANLLFALIQKLCQQNQNYCKQPQPQPSRSQRNSSSQSRKLCLLITKPPSKLLQGENKKIDSIFPSFDVTFNKTKISTKPSQYFVKYGETIVQELYCLGFQAAAQGYGYLVGVNWLIKKQITLYLDKAVLSITNNKDCAYHQPNSMSQPRIRVQTLLSYLLLLAVFSILVFMAQIIQKLRTLKKKICKKNVQLVEQEGAQKSEQLVG